MKIQVSREHFKQIEDDLVLVDRPTSSCVQSPPTSIALEMFGFLVRDQNLQIIEVALAIVTPRAAENFFEIRMTALFLTHGECGYTERLVLGKCKLWDLGRL